jgi:hypothetical protein
MGSRRFGRCIVERYLDGNMTILGVQTQEEVTQPSRWEWLFLPQSSPLGAVHECETRFIWSTADYLSKIKYKANQAQR